jgi:excisionase family DNA binding protein
MQNEALRTRQQAADFLGISLRTIDSLIASGELPCVPIKRSVRIRPSALEEFIESLETRRNPHRRTNQRPSQSIS